MCREKVQNKLKSSRYLKKKFFFRIGASLSYRDKFIIWIYLWVYKDGNLHFGYVVHLSKYLLKVPNNSLPLKTNQTKPASFQIFVCSRLTTKLSSSFFSKLSE